MISSIMPENNQDATAGKSFVERPSVERPSVEKPPVENPAVEKPNTGRSTYKKLVNEIP